MNTAQLMMFCCSNEPEVLELLLKKSTSGMNVVNKARHTSLHVAVCKQFADCVRVLLKYRCDVNVQVTGHLYIRIISICFYASANNRRRSIV